MSHPGREFARIARQRRARQPGLSLSHAHRVALEQHQHRLLDLLCVVQGLTALLLHDLRQVIGQRRLHVGLGNRRLLLAQRGLALHGGHGAARHRREAARGHRMSRAFCGITGRADTVDDVGGLPLLDDVGQLMSQQVVAAGRPRPVRASAEDDVVARGKGDRPHLAGGLTCVRTGVHPDTGEVVPQPRLHGRAQRPRQRVAGASGFRRFLLGGDRALAAHCLSRFRPARSRRRPLARVRSHLFASLPGKPLLPSCWPGYLPRSLRPLTRRSKPHRADGSVTSRGR